MTSGPNEPPMRILRVADVPNNRIGGASRAMHSTGSVLAQRGHQVDFLFSEDLTAPGPATLRRFLIPWKLPRLIRQRAARAGAAYDVVELHEPLGAVYCALRRARPGANLPPVVLYSHGLEERGRIADLAYRRQKNLPIGLKQRYSPLSVTLQARYAVRRADHVLCCNSEDVAYLHREGVPARRLTRIRTGVEPEFLVAGKAVVGEAPANSGEILYLGSWLPRKGILDVVPAVSQVLRRRPAARFTVAGCGCEAQTVLAQFPAELRERVRVIPKLQSNAALINVYRRHAIFVLPSVFEGQPAVMIEAAALGLALVTTNVCGMADFVQNNVTGLSVPVGDVNAIAACLETLVDDPALARRLGDAARTQAQEHTWARAAVAVGAAYRQAAGHDDD